MTISTNIVVECSREVRPAEIMDLNMAAGRRAIPFELGQNEKWPEIIDQAVCVVTARVAKDEPKGGMLVGLGIMSGEFPTVEVSEIPVHRTFRGQQLGFRIGNELLRFVIEHQQEQSIQ